ncbi:MAG: DUF4386 domain-containing protein [Archangium sp.]|nr:DUF4386 domain-containing protein [Archangium sp.]
MTELKMTARVTGFLYLALAVAGGLGFLLVRPALYVAEMPAETARNLVSRAAMARFGVVLELLTVATQALTAVWFFKLFRGVNVVAAMAIAAFGLMNAVAILGSAACLSTALVVVGDATLAPGGDVGATVQLFYVVSERLWSVGALFFGLWLVPMGHIARTSRHLPKALGWTLLVGGVGYTLSALVANGVPDAPRWLADALTIPATVGELWMIGFLLIVGLRPLESRPS